MKNELGAKIRMYRQKRQLSQKDFAEKIGVSSSRLSNWEKGINRPDLENLSLICSILHVSSDELLEIEQPKDIFTFEEKQIINGYRQLDNRGKKNVHLIIEGELEYSCSCPSPSQQLPVEEKEELSYNNTEKLFNVSNNIMQMSADDYEKRRNIREEETGKLDFAAFGGATKEEEAIFKEFKKAYQEQEKEKGEKETDE